MENFNPATPTIPSKLTYLDVVELEALLDSLLEFLLCLELLLPMVLLLLSLELLPPLPLLLPLLSELLLEQLLDSNWFPNHVNLFSTRTYNKNHISTSKN